MRIKSAAMVASLTLLNILLNYPLANATMYLIGDIGCEIQHEFLNRTEPAPLYVVAYISENKREFLSLAADAKTFKISAFVPNTGEALNKLQVATEKAIEWSKVAREKKVDVDKEIDCIGGGDDGACIGTENQINMFFLSSDKGENTRLVLKMTHANKEYITARVYLDSKGMERLLSIIKNAAGGFEKARDLVQNKELFQ
jgi:hypothetical protein